jgi:hypothetical protein
MPLMRARRSAARRMRRYSSSSSSAPSPLSTSSSPPPSTRPDVRPYPSPILRRAPNPRRNTAGGSAPAPFVCASANSAVEPWFASCGSGFTWHGGGGGGSGQERGAAGHRSGGDDGGLRRGPLHRRQHEPSPHPRWPSLRPSPPSLSLSLLSPPSLRPFLLYSFPYPRWVAEESAAAAGWREGRELGA